VHRQEEELRNTNVRRSADCTFRRARAKSIHSASGSFLSAFLPEKDGWAFLGGKSEFVDEIAMRLLLRHDWKVGYFSPENTPL
jgi:hypothetical protein